MAGYKRNIGSNFITQSVNITAGFLTSVLIARELGPNLNGYISYLILVFGLIASYGHFGINDAADYFQKRSNYKEEVVFSSNITYLLLLSIMFSFGILVLKFKNIIFQDYDINLIVLGIIFMAASFIFTNANYMYIGNEKIPEINKYIIGTKILYCIIILVLFILNKINVYTYFGTSVGIVVIKTIFVVKNIGINYRFKLNKTLLKEEFKYGKYIYFSVLFIFLNYRVDQILIKNMLGKTELGIYSISVQLAELVFLVPASIVTALSGKLYNIDENSKDRHLVTSMTIKYTFYICLILGIVGYFMTPLIPLVYGNAYKDAVSVTSILFIGIVFASVGKIASAYFFTKGETKKYLIITSITLGVNLFFNFIFIPKIGINGAAVASTISYIIYGLMFIVYLLHKEDYRIKELFYFKDIIYKLKLNKFMKSKGRIYMSNKQKYREICEKEESIPIFSKYWWMDAVCGEDNWDVILVEKGRQVFAAMPYYIKKNLGKSIICQPELTQKNGIWIKYPNNQGYLSKLEFEKKIMLELVDKIEELDINYYYQQFDYSIENWLPFYWKGYNQTTRYTYVIENLKNINYVYRNFERRTKRNIIKASEIVKIKEAYDIELFYEVNKLTFIRQNMDIPYSLDLVRRIDYVCEKRKCRKIYYAIDREDRIHAAIYLIWDENSAYYLMCGSDPKLRSSQAVSLLIWEAIKFSSTVTKKFDFNGSMIEPIERFMRSFGAVQKPYFAISKDLKNNTLYDIAKIIYKNNPKLKKLYTKLRGK